MTAFVPHKRKPASAKKYEGVPQINRAKDFIERVGWTFIQAEISLGALDWLAKGINLDLLHQLEISLGAALAATVKVLLAQQIGKRGSGDAIPGGVVKGGP